MDVGTEYAFFKFPEFSCETGVTYLGDGLTYQVVSNDTPRTSDEIHPITEGLLFNITAPDSNRDLFVYPIDPNTVSNFGFYIKVSSGE